MVPLDWSDLNRPDLFLGASEPQLQEISVFHPSPTSVATIQHFRENPRLSKSFVNVHRDGIPPEDLASFPCCNPSSSLPATESVSTVLTTAGSLSLILVLSPKLERFDWT